MMSSEVGLRGVLFLRCYTNRSDIAESVCFHEISF